jgi:hypothetical protein
VTEEFGEAGERGLFLVVEIERCRRCHGNGWSAVEACRWRSVVDAIG